MTQKTTGFPMTVLQGLGGVSLLVVLLLSSGALAGTHAAPNGILLRIHTPDELATYIHNEPGVSLLRHPALGEVELLTGPEDPRLPRRDVDAFVPLDPAVVRNAVVQLHSLQVDLEVDVFLLPAPPAETLGSFARRGAIVLSPGFGAADPRIVSELVIHELGHVLTWAYFDHRPDAWTRYNALRGLDPQLNGPTAPHAERAREILAEDIRFLFGGELANWHGSIENAAIGTPDRVEGLTAFFTSILSGSPGAAAPTACSAWPNPCNPLTTISMAIPPELAGSAALPTLRVLDLRGRVVRTVLDGAVRNGEAVAQWDGRRDDGGEAASGRYLYVMTWNDRVGRGTVTLVR